MLTTVATIIGIGLLTDKVKIKHQRDTRRNEEKRHVIRKKLTHGFDGSGTHHSPIEQERQNQHPQILPGIVIPGTRANNSPKNRHPKMIPNCLAISIAIEL